MRTVTLCACGKRMSKYSNDCKACHAIKQAQWEENRQNANLILAQKPVILETSFGDYVLSHFRDNLDAVTYPAGKSADSYNQRTFALHGGHVQQVLQGKERIR